MVGEIYHCIMVRSIVRLYIRYYCCFMEGYVIYIGAASTLHCRRAKILLLLILIIIMMYDNDDNDGRPLYN